MTKLSERDEKTLLELAALRNEPLHPDLVPYVEEGAFGRMLRHPLVYDLMVDALPGQANKAYLHKKRLLDEYIAEENWGGAVWLHERPYRLQALIDYCTGRADDEGGTPLPLVGQPRWYDLASQVWTDSENIAQCIDDWRALFAHEPGTLWLGDRQAFDALDWHDDGTIIALRGGAVGDWSWTVSREVAEFFSRQSGYAPRRARIHRDECFGYLTHRSEYELLVRFDESRREKIYPADATWTGAV